MPNTNLLTCAAVGCILGSCHIIEEPIDTAFVEELDANDGPPFYLHEHMCTLPNYEANMDASAFDKLIKECLDISRPGLNL